MMNTIPEEICLHIFSFLSIRTIIVKLPLVCKTWRRISRDLQLCKTFIDSSTKLDWTILFLPDLNSVCQSILRDTFHGTSIDVKQFVHESRIYKNQNLYICYGKRYMNHVIAYPQSALQELINQCHVTPTYVLVTVIKNIGKTLIQTTIRYEFMHLRQMIQETDVNEPHHIMNKWPFRSFRGKNIHYISMIGLVVQKTGHLSLDVFLRYLSSVFL